MTIRANPWVVPGVIALLGSASLFACNGETESSGGMGGGSSVPSSNGVGTDGTSAGGASTNDASSTGNVFVTDHAITSVSGVGGFSTIGIDLDGDGIIDGYDTDGDGIIDASEPPTGSGGAGGSSGRDGPTQTEDCLVFDCAKYHDCAETCESETVFFSCCPCEEGLIDKSEACSE